MTIPFFYCIDSRTYGMRRFTHQPNRRGTPAMSTSTYTSQYVTHQGDRYDDTRPPNETTRLIRQDVKAAVKAGQLPAGRYSVTRAKGSWSSVYVTIVDPDQEAWFRPVDPSSQADAQAIYRGIDRVIKESYQQTADTLRGIAERYVRNTTDSMTDYWSGGYVHVFLSTAANGGGVVL